MSETDSPAPEKKTYDDIPFEVFKIEPQKRRKLIFLIDEKNWTIRSAAQKLGIKVCTAKYILYLYRKEGKIYKKKGEGSVTSKETEDIEDREPGNVVYVPIPVPIYFFCWCSPGEMPINLDHIQGA